MSAYIIDAVITEGLLHDLLSSFSSIPCLLCDPIRQV